MNVISSAAKGNRRQIEYLYNQNKQRVYCVAKCLLDSEEEAANVTAYAFNNSWDIIRGDIITTEQEFTALVIRQAVDYCKRKAQKADSKAFRMPADRNFFVTAKGEVPADSKDELNDLLRLLPTLQRFIFVLHTVGGYSNKQIADIFKFDIKTVEAALSAERVNISRLLKNQKAENQSVEYAEQLIELRAKEICVSPLADKKIADVIDRICLPFEKKKRKTVLAVCIAVAVLCACGIGVFKIADNTKTTATSADSDSSTDTSDTEQNENLLDTSLTYYADIEIENYGTVTVELDEESAPITCANFVDLANSGFYDGLTFHRIIEDFMMQGGDPNGDGTGGSDTTIVGEFTDNGYDNDLSHTRGAVSMARSSDYDSASSQFFIVHEDSTYLDGQYAVFGYVTEGMDIVDEVCESAEPTDDNGTIPTDEQPVITAISIRTE